MVTEEADAEKVEAVAVRRRWQRQQWQKTNTHGKYMTYIYTKQLR